MFLRDSESCFPCIKPVPIAITPNGIKENRGRVEAEAKDLRSIPYIEFTADLTMAALVPFMGPAMNLVTGASNVYKFFKTLNDVPEEGFFLWKLIEATEPALELAEEMCIRHIARPYLQSAVMVTRHTIANCEEVQSLHVLCRMAFSHSGCA